MSLTLAAEKSHRFISLFLFFVKSLRFLLILNCCSIIEIWVFVFCC
jgi:hypothetical protein